MFYFTMGNIMFRIMWGNMKRKIIWVVISTIIMVGILTLSSCGVTKTTTHNCELMEQGQKCLPDHSCCKQ